MGGRVRHWVWTLNNYNAEQREHIASVVAPAASFLIYQPERGEQGTPHLQGFVSFENPRAFAGVQRLFGACGVHLERMRGTLKQAIDYCRKEDTRDPEAGFDVVTFGREPDGPGQGSRSDLDAIGARLREGEAIKKIAEDYPGDFIRYSRGFIEYANLFAPVRNEKTVVHWYYGTTGTGKSRAALARSPDAYWKSADHTWWNGYDGRADVVIDDYRCCMCKFSYLLNLFDRYPFQVQIKGGVLNFAARNIYVTAPQRPEKMWASRTNEQIAQLLRRIENIELFGEEPEEPAVGMVEGFVPN